MERLTADMRTIADGFVQQVKTAFGEGLSSVILYGPAARGETSKQPYIRFLVVTADNTPSELARCTPYLKEWRKKLIAIPLFLAPEYIERSLDTFPLEFMDMRSSYTVVHGADVLADLVFATADVRAECEREIKGKLLHLRAEYLDLRGNEKGLVDLVGRSLATFRLVFSGALHLKELEIPTGTAEKVDAVVDAYELDKGLFTSLTGIAAGTRKIDAGGADRLFDRYVEELDKLSGAIDRMEV